MTRDKAKAAKTDRELTVRELDTVSGGLNPQPLPPRHMPGFIFFLNPQPLPPG